VVLSRLDTTAIVKGAALAGVVALASGLIQRAVPSGSSLIGLLFLLIILAMAAGGFVAAMPQPATGLTAGALAGLLAGAVLQLVNVGAAIARGTFSLGTLATVVLAILICTSAGSLGGYAAFRRSPEGGSER
jgi:hypothetical protein